MDEIDLMTLIAEGENERLDFKRELKLHSAREKAEFIKDILSLANSARDVGYLLVGVDDSKLIVGAANLEEERIQQIASTYITPALSLKCHSLPVALPNFPLVVVIEIRAFRKPHKVGRAIESLNQDDVFVRRGSVVAKASPEEIIRMAGETTNQEDRIQQRINVAETHVRLRNWRNAISLYTQAIGEMPTSELLLSRGKAYHSASKEQLTARKPEGVPDNEWAGRLGDYASLLRYAYKDYTDAISLSSSVAVEKEARLQRMLLDLTTMHDGQDYDEWESDVTWLKLHTTGREHGEVLFLEQQVYFSRVGPDALNQESVVALTRAIEMGYTETEAYFLRGQANASTFNFGLALQDLDTVVTKTDSKNPRMVDYLVCRAEILVEMRRYAEAHETLLQANRLDPREMQAWMWDTQELYDHCLVRWALQTEFNKGTKSEKDEVEKIMNRILVLCRGYTWLRRKEASYPGFMSTIQELLGENLWLMLKRRLAAFMVDIQTENIRERTVLHRISIEIPDRFLDKGSALK